MILATRDGFALDVPGGSMATGLELNMWTYNGSAAQIWRFVGVDELKESDGQARGPQVDDGQASDLQASDTAPTTSQRQADEPAAEVRSMHLFAIPSHGYIVRDL